jgi:hypothetical protein
MKYFSEKYSSYLSRAVVQSWFAIDANLVPSILMLRSQIATSGFNPKERNPLTTHLRYTIFKYFFESRKLRWAKHHSTSSGQGHKGPDSYRDGGAFYCLLW